MTNLRQFEYDQTNKQTDEETEKQNYNFNYIYIYIRLFKLLQSFDSALQAFESLIFEIKEENQQLGKEKSFQHDLLSFL